MCSCYYSQEGAVKASHRGTLGIFGGQSPQRWGLFPLPKDNSAQATGGLIQRVQLIFEFMEGCQR